MNMNIHKVENKKCIKIDSYIFTASMCHGEFYVALELTATEARAG
jgi:hypothetical protein